MTWLQAWIINQDPVAQLAVAEKGGPGSGNWGHAGVKGTRGGSAPKRGKGAAMSLATGKDWEERQMQTIEDAYLADAEDSSKRLYQAAVKGGKLSTKEQRKDALKSYKALKELDRHSMYEPMDDYPAMSEALAYTVSHGSLKQARANFQEIADLLVDPKRKEEEEWKVHRVDAITRARGERVPGLKKQAKPKPVEVVKPSGPEAKKILDAKPVTDDYYINRPVSRRTIGGGVTSEWQKVKAKPVKVAGYEDQDFFIHRPLGSRKSGWTISEGRTGTSLVLQYGGTQAKAIRKLTTILDKIKKAGRTTFQNKITSAVNASTQRGQPLQSPRYGGTGPIYRG